MNDQMAVRARPPCCRHRCRRLRRNGRACVFVFVCALHNASSFAFVFACVVCGGPVPNSSKYGHNKGVIGIATSGASGFWLVHSAPAFPGVSGGSMQPYPDTAVRYGQSFLCISLNTAGLADIVTPLRLFRPQFYAVSLSSAVVSTLPSLADVCMNGVYDSKANGAYIGITSVGGTSFTAFGKNAAWVRRQCDGFD